MTGAPASISIDVGVLELVGFPVARRFAIARAFEDALGRLVRDRGLPPTLTAHPRVEGRGPPRPPARISLDPDTSPRLIGEAIARAVYQGLR